jgi:hypothetical protein
MISDSLLDPGGLNTIIYNDPYAKLCLVSTIILELQEERRKKALYIDLDTVFTAYVKAGLIPPLKIKKMEPSIYASDILRIYIPDEMIQRYILDSIKYLDEASIVIFDSITSFYSLFYNELESDKSVTREMGRINQFLLILLMLLLKNTSFSKIPLLLTSMIRYKRKEGWIGTPTGNRFLRSRSSVNLYVEMENERDLSINVLSHPTITPQKIIFRDKGIRISRDS